MSNHWAIAVGINHYQLLQPLHFAQQDAQSLCESLVSDAGFLPDRCLLITDTSPEFDGHSTDPNRENLLHWFQSLREKLQPEDWVWCFFSGYGFAVAGEDYLLPIDADPEKPAQTGISAKSLFDALKALPTDNVLVLLDINRAQSLSNEKVGTQIAKLAAEYGIPTMLSCQPEEFSHEAPALNHGLFTQALIEGLRSHQCSNLASLEEFLKSRLPELCDHSDRPIQNPLLIVSEPKELHQVIMPVNWEETENWKPIAESNPFAVEGDLYLSPIETEALTFEDYDTIETQTIMGATATETPDYLKLEPDFVTMPPEDNPPPQAAQLSEPVSPVPPVSNASDNSDQMFWERLLFGGSAILLVLLLGVLFRNWSAFMGNPQTASKGDTPPSQTVQSSKPGEASPAPQTTSANAPQANPASTATNGEQVLNEARSLIRPASASEASQAIQRALKIPQGDPVYAQAQQDIDRWSRNILDIAKSRAAQKQFKSAIAAAQFVPKERPQLHAEAQKLMQQWRQRAR